jgi:hypothetical protein
MTLDIGHIREYMFEASGGVIAKPPLSKEWLASLQILMISLSSVWRFWFNEARSVPNVYGTLQHQRWPTVLLACFSFAGASAVLGVILWALLSGLPSAELLSDERLQTDVAVIRALTLVWIGYPVVAIISRLSNCGIPGDQYNKSFSLFNDAAYALLDTFSKGGLAIYVVLKATDMSAAEESALVAAGRLAMNATR